MAIKKKDMKQKMAEYTYGKPKMEKRILGLKKSLKEVSGILNEKEKHP